MEIRECLKLQRLVLDSEIHNITWADHMDLETPAFILPFLVHSPLLYMILVCIHLSVNVFIVSTCCCFLMTKLNLVVARARICYFLFCTKMEVQKKPKLSTKHMAVLLLFAKGWQWVVPYMMNMCLLLILGLDILWVYSTLDVYNNIMVLYWIFVDF